MSALDCLLTQLRDELSNLLEGDVKVTLYGSHARGTATPDSDVDVLIVLRRADPALDEAIHQVAYRLMWESDFNYVLALNVMDARQYDELVQHHSSFLRNVEREGIAL